MFQKVLRCQRFKNTGSGAKVLHNYCKTRHFFRARKAPGLKSNKLGAGGEVIGVAGYECDPVFMNSSITRLTRRPRMTNTSMSTISTLIR